MNIYFIACEDLLERAAEILEARDTTWAEKKGKMEKRRVKKTMGYK